MLRVGLTGGIACGKSHVLQRLAARGCRTLDLDQAARDVTAAGSPALAEIEAAFGAGVVRDGVLDRAALGARVFEDAPALARLNAIVHPRVWAVEAAWAAAQPTDAVRVTDAALLVETGAHLRFDRLVVVHCDPALQLARLRARDGLDARTAQARIDSQMALAEKRAFGHFEIDTSRALVDTDGAADALASTLAALNREKADASDAAIDRFVGGLLHGPEEGPRGLSPERLLAAAHTERGLEMAALAERLVPKAPGPWYRAAVGVPPGAPASRLAVALAAWASGRRRADSELAAAAGASVARLVHGDAASRADTCLAALVALDLACGRAEAVGARSAAARSHALAVRFGGGAPSGRLDALWEALERHPGRPAEAEALCASLGGDGPTAAALAGLGTPFDESPRSRSWRDTLAAV